VPAKRNGAQEQIIETMLYLLWDAGLKVGHATRTIDDCIRLARDDLSIRTSLLEARWLWGDKAGFDAFERRFFSDVVDGSGRAFVEAKLAERDARHERTGDSRYVLEPHIKEGKGGLRDLQTLFWLAKYLYRVKDIAELVEQGVFAATDIRQFRKAQDFLWTVRCHLHYVAGRPEERLTFNVQEEIAERLGYNDRGGIRGVERFMKHYFHITRTVGDLTRILCAVLEEEQKKPKIGFRLPSLMLFRRPPPGFRFDNDRLTTEAPDAFEKDPVKILALFHTAQRTGHDIHPKALRQVQQNLGLINPALRQDPAANRLFMEMLTAEVDPEPILKRLNESGVFGRFIPDFGRVVSQMQYDMYHHFTVDEHSIHAIGILGRIERGELASEHPTATKAFGEILSRQALYLAVLLHDVGKARGGDHSEIGAEIAIRLAPRLGLDAWETETVTWLVRHHLLMARTAFKRDVDDPKTVTDFTEVVQSPERLRLLLILTNADITAVGPTVWNGWKEGLLAELYYRALEEMEMTGGQPPQRRMTRVETAKAKLRERLAGWGETTLEPLVARGYPDYWLAFDTDEHVRHFAMMRDADDKGLNLMVEADRHPSRDVTRITVYAPDHPGLFARLAGAIALSAASIVDAKIITLANSMALDVLHVQGINGQHIAEPDRIERLVGRIRDAITSRINPSAELELARRRALPSRTRVFKVPPRVLFDNKASATHTVIEVNGRDRLGFLHDVTAAITGLGLQIGSAHISTYGHRVVDVFYVKDSFGLKIEPDQKLERIEETLLAAISGREVAAPAPAEEPVPA
jgi:[protein-PII] uridylyltransferase